MQNNVKWAKFFQAIKDLRSNIHKLQVTFVSGLLLLIVAALAIGSFETWVPALTLTPYISTALVGGFTLCMAASMFNFVLNLTVQEEIGRVIQYTLFTALGSSALSGLGFLYKTGSLHAEVFYFCALTSNGLLLFTMLAIASLNLNLPPVFAYLFAGGHGLFLAVLGLMAYFEQWGSPSQTLVISGILRDALTGFFPVTFALVTKLSPSLRLSPNNFKESLSLRFMPTPKNRPYLLQFYALTSFSLGYAMVSGILAAHAQQSEEITNLPPVSPLYLICLGWLPSTIGSFFIYLGNRSNLSKNALLANLSSTQAKRFLFRYRSDHSSWAATVGLRTANFMIDHDPNDDVGHNLPSTLGQIRKDEIRRFVEKLLGPKLLHKRILGNQVYGSIDPEFSYHSCIDALRLIACVYIDAIPVIERRLKSLSSLFPIIDPELADSIRPENIEDTMAQIEWIFHLDYDWVDQNLIQTPTQIDYGISSDNLTLSHRYHVLSYLKRQNRLGNFVWLGEKVRERLLMEAPYLASIIEAWPISMPDENNDMIIFLIKFEELIPRLQKYYNLEDTRALINDYEPSKESRRILNMLDMQLTQYKQPKKIMDTLTALSSNQWRGYKEKDLALRIALKAYEKLKDLDLIENPQNPLSSAYRAKLLEAISVIGYPSQLLHMAHMNKIRLRRADQILDIARKPHSRRFDEAWLLLSSISPHRYTADELREFVNLIMEAITSPSLNLKEIVKSKAIEAFFNVAHGIDFNSDKELICDAVNRLGQYLAQQKADIELCCFYLDAKIFLEEQIKETILLSPRTIGALSQHCDNLFKSLGAKSPAISSLASRWRNLIQQQQNPTSMPPAELPISA